MSLAVSLAGVAAAARADDDGDHRGRDSDRHGRRSPRVVVISLDGAKPDFIQKFIDEGVLPRDGGLARLSRHGAVAAQNVTASPSLTAVSHIEIATGSTVGPQRHPVEHLPGDRRADLIEHQWLRGTDRRLSREPARAFAAADGVAAVGAAAPTGQEGGHRDVAGQRRRQHLHQQHGGAAGPADPRHRLHRAVRGVRRHRRPGLLAVPGRLRGRSCGCRGAPGGRPLLVQPGAGDVGADRDVLVLLGADRDLHQCGDARPQIRDPGGGARHHQ